MRLVSGAFVGMVPKLADRLLNEAQASFAANLKAVSGNARGFRGLEPVYEIPAETGQVFHRARRLYYRGSDEYVWWVSLDADADVLLNPLASDAFERFYTTQKGSPPQVNTLDRYKNGDPSYPLGYARPTAAPTVTITGGSGSVNETRAYLYILVSAWGEESAPSPATVATGKPDATWTIGALPAGAQPNQQYTDIYRSAVGTQGAGNFYRVGRVTVGTTTFVDSMSASNVPLQPELGSVFNEPPPSNLMGLVMHSSGAAVGFFGRTVCFSLSYLPNAWPSEQRYTVKDEVVGLAAVSNAIIVMTTGHPVIIAGNDPAAVSIIDVADHEPCLNRRSIVVSNNRAVYASPNGLIGIGTAGIDRPTAGVVTNEEWAVYQPGSLIAQMYGPWYVAFHEPSRGLALPLPPLGDASITVLDRYDGISGIEIDDRSGDVLVISRNIVSRFDALSGRRFAVTWRSKRFITPKPVNFGAIQIYFIAANQDDAANQRLQDLADAYNVVRMTQGPLEALGLSCLGIGVILPGALPIAPEIAPAPVSSIGGGPLFQAGEWLGEMTVRATIIADNVVRYSKLLTASTVYKLPSGYKATEWFVELSGRAEIEKMVVAETGKECAED